MRRNEDRPSSSARGVIRARAVRRSAKRGKACRRARNRACARMPRLVTIMPIVAAADSEMRRMRNGSGEKIENNPRLAAAMALLKLHRERNEALKSLFGIIEE